jgi:hypothetical protein
LRVNSTKNDLLYIKVGQEVVADLKPSQALPRQLSQRESQAVKFITKVLGIMRRFPAVLLALPLGELASPTGLD